VFLKVVAFIRAKLGFKRKEAKFFRKVRKECFTTNLSFRRNLKTINVKAKTIMKAVIQRVTHSSVTINSKIVAEISSGLLVLLGIEEADNQEDIDWLTSKIVNLRIFGDENQVMNLSLKDIDGEMIIVSQFTLHALTKKGNRPSYIKAAKPEIAIPLYEKFIAKMETELGKKIQTGQFGADMKVALLNDGPVTIIIDSKNKQ